jgi:hypothetical protein
MSRRLSVPKNCLARSMTLAVLKSGYPGTTAYRTVPLGGIHERAKYPQPYFNRQLYARTVQVGAQLPSNAEGNFAPH